MLDLEPQLRHEFQIVAQSVEIPTGSVAALVPVATGAPRQQKHWGWATATGILAALVLIGAGALGRNMLSGNEKLSGQPATPEPTETQDYWDWIDNLPPGAAPQLPYIDGDVLVTPDGKFRLPGDDAGLVGEADNGYVVLIEYDRSEFYSEYGLVSTTGDYEPLPVGDGPGYNAAISPDGELVAYQGIVLDVARRTVIADLPAITSYVRGWGNNGILLATSSEGNDGIAIQDITTGSTTTLQVDVFANAATDNIALVAGKCSQAGTLSTTGNFSALYEGCGPESVDAVSPDGKILVLQGLTLLDTNTRNPLPLAIPPIRYAAGRVAWEDNTTMLLLAPVEADRPYGAPQQVIRCDLLTNTCERAGDPITLTSGESLDLAPGSSGA